MVLGISQGNGGCVFGMGKTMGRVPRLETAENDEFLKKCANFLNFLLGFKNGPLVAQRF